MSVNIKFEGHSDDIVHVLVNDEIQDEYYPDEGQRFRIEDTDKTLGYIKPVFGKNGFSWSFLVEDWYDDDSTHPFSLCVRDGENVDLTVLDLPLGSTVQPDWEEEEDIW